MSIEQWAESFGTPSNAASIHRLLRNILNTILSPAAAFNAEKLPKTDCLRLKRDPATWNGTGVSSLLAEVASEIVQGAIQTRHPYAMAHMVPPPATISVIADLLIGALNQCAFIWEEAPVASLLEEESIRWLCDAIGYGIGSGGILTSGGTVSNLLATHLAREQARASRQDANACVVASDQAHFSIEKAVSLIGLTPSALVRVTTDSQGRLPHGRLTEWVDNLTNSGKSPFLLVCTAGTTNAGLLEPAAEFCRVAHIVGSWCHIDAAHGGIACLSTYRKDAAEAWSDADSVSWDPHKTLYASYSVGALLLRSVRALHSLRFGGAYALSEGNSRDAGLYHFEGSRRLEALKVWMLIRHFGISGYQELVDYSFMLAREFAGRIRRLPHFALLTDPDTNIVCFRYEQDRLSQKQADELNDAIQQHLFQAGGPLLSTTKIMNATYLRAVLLNPLLRVTDLDGLIDRIRERAQLLVAQTLYTSRVGHRDHEHQPCD